MPNHMIVSTLAFSRRPLAGVIAGIAALEFSQIDLALFEGWAHFNPSELAAGGPARVHAAAAEVRGLLAAHGMRQASACNVGLGTPDWAEQRRRLEAVCDLAVLLGAPVIAIGAAPRATPVTEEVERLRQLVPIARDRGVALTVETHVGQVAELPSVAAELCREVEGLGLTLDATHFHAGPNQGADFSVVFPFVRHVHLRDGGGDWGHIQVPAGQGQVDFHRIATGLWGAGYRGKFALEYIDSIPLPGGQDTTAELLRMRDLFVGTEQAAGIVRTPATV